MTFGSRMVVPLVIAFALATCLCLPAAAPVEHPSRCDLCGKTFVEVSLRVTDEVTGEIKVICHRCYKSKDICYACGVPIIKDMVTLEDGRHYCARDAKTAILDINAVLRIAREADGTLRLQLQEYLNFPDESTLDRRVIDRVELNNWYKVSGHDSQCPNVLGLYESITNNGALQHRIHVLSGLTLGQTRTTYAHELTHAWLAGNVPAGRNLGRNAREGFCELISYLLAVNLNDAQAQQVISSNAYTRGQFSLFRAACNTYTLRPVIDWVKYGKEPEIDAADIDLVRRAAPPPRPVRQNWVRYVTPGTAAAIQATNSLNEFELKGIIGTDRRRTALINGRAFLDGETGSVRLGDTNRVVIKCLGIAADSVTIKILATGREQVLHLPPVRQ